MGKITNISWTDATWNIARGCDKVDADCKYCYMYRDSLNGTRYDPKGPVKTKTVFNLPLKLKEPSRIFTSSLTDFFHEGCDSFRDEAWDIIRRCPQHTFQILTKRPERILECLPPDWGSGYANVWIGTSIGSNAGMVRLPHLVKVPAVVLFISFEPLYERINWDAASLAMLGQIQWAIIGGESGNENGLYKYRPCSLEWIADIGDKCDSYGVKVFVKQMGTHLAKQMNLNDRHGGDISEWPVLFRVREMPI